MRYLGSKNRLTDELCPIIQSFITSKTKGYIEPFVGSASVINKIHHSNRIGYDLHPQLIALLQHIQNDISDVPDSISEEEYQKVRTKKENYPDWYVGLVGFCATFGSKYFGGYARDEKSIRNPTKEAIDHLIKFKPDSDITFECKSFLDIDISNIKNSVIYCDPPYKDTSTYSTSKFPHDEFYEWSIKLAKNNTVLISEYNMPSEFNRVWSKDTVTNFSSYRDSGTIDTSKIRTERLYTPNVNLLQTAGLLDLF